MEKLVNLWSNILFEFSVYIFILTSFTEFSSFLFFQIWKTIIRKTMCTFYTYTNFNKISNPMIKFQKKIIKILLPEKMIINEKGPGEGLKSPKFNFEGSLRENFLNCPPSIWTKSSWMEWTSQKTTGIKIFT